METITAPTQIIILGGSGDLSKRKLLPALFDLYLKQKLPNTFSIIGLARTPRTDNEYREFVLAALTEHGHDHDVVMIKEFCECITYVSGSFDDDQAYTDLNTTIATYEQGIGQCTNKLFYLAVPPLYYENIFEKLHEHNMSTPCDAVHGWTRVLVEKPFGSDFESARNLDEKLSSLFDEEQIFRIDHYLAKEAVQNILAFRFSNMLLSAPWDKRGIDHICITMHEKIDVQNRGAFYDGIGALRDVGQNHLLQLLALIAMNEPEELTAAHIRDERERILNALSPVGIDTLEEQVVRAQYESYKETEGVTENSTTETFFELKATLTLDEWEGVPFYISAGKGLEESKVSVDIYFKDVAEGPFGPDNCESVGNHVKLTISPEQRIDITLNAKAPGLDMQLEQRTLSFACAKGDSEIKNSYEKVLLDCIAGDQTLFTKTEEVLASWKFISPILEHWNKIQLQPYQKGSSGPEDRLLS